MILVWKCFVKRIWTRCFRSCAGRMRRNCGPPTVCPPQKDWRCACGAARRLWRSAAKVKCARWRAWSRRACWAGARAYGPGRGKAFCGGPKPFGKRLCGRWLISAGCIRSFTPPVTAATPRRGGICCVWGRGVREKAFIWREKKRNFIYTVLARLPARKIQ